MAPIGLWLGVVALALLSAAALIADRPRERMPAMVLAFALAPVLIAADNWDTARFEEIRSSPAIVIAVVAGVAAAVAALAALFTRLPAAFALAALAMLPFRVPIEVGSQTANLLVPLYLVLAAGVAAAAYRHYRSLEVESGPTETSPFSAWVRRLLAIAIVLYALQAGYSEDFSRAVEVTAFFLAPFALLFVLLSQQSWSPKLLRVVLAVAIVEGLVFALVGFGQSITRELFWNEKVIAGNEVHSWFRVNSLFWDPNILGRYLAVTLIGVAAVLAWARRAESALLAAGIAAVLLFAIALTFSQSSLVALLAGLVVLAGLRWSVKWTSVAAAALALLAVIAVFAGAPGTDFGSDSIEAETSGRAGLISGGIDIAQDQPLLGEGSGAFETVFLDRFAGGVGISVVSHTEPVTVAAEQGAVGLLVYVALISTSLLALFSGLRRLVPGFGAGAPPSGTGLTAGAWPGAGRWKLGAARAAMISAFVAMIVHSFAYAAFLTDPITWALLAIGLALAGQVGSVPSPESPPPAERRPSAAAQPAAT